jgi:hypothetical protein
MSTEFNYRSLSHRLLGRIYATKDDWANAVTELKSAVDLSPDYPEANYDYARYCVQAGNLTEWAAPLRAAILAKPEYWLSAWAERNFFPVRKELAALLKQICVQPHKSLIAEISEAEAVLRNAEKTLASTRNLMRHSTYRRNQRAFETELSPGIDAAKSDLAKAKALSTSVDYPSLLKAGAAARKATKGAKDARDKAQSWKTQSLHFKKGNAGRALRRFVKSAFGTWLMGMVGWVVFGMGGCLLRVAGGGRTGANALEAYKREANYGLAIAVVVGGVLTVLACKDAMDGGPDDTSS